MMCDLSVSPPDAELKDLSLKMTQKDFEYESTFVVDPCETAAAP